MIPKKRIGSLSEAVSQSVEMRTNVSERLPKKGPWNAW